MNQVSGLEKIPKTERGRRTRNKLLEAAEVEFGKKGFHETGIIDITYRAGVSLGTFYTYFESKDEIFRALVRHMGQLNRTTINEKIANVQDHLTRERVGIEAFIEFARQHKAIYRIVTEAEFVAPQEYRNHYEGYSRAYQANLEKAAQKGQIRKGDFETWSWSIMGIIVFLGMRYGQWDESRTASDIADVVVDLITRGIAPEPDI